MVRAVIIGASLLVLSGCGTGDDTADLRTQVSELQVENSQLQAQIEATSTPPATTTTSATTPPATATTSRPATTTTSGPPRTYMATSTVPAETAPTVSAGPTLDEATLQWFRDGSVIQTVACVAGVDRASDYAGVDLDEATFRYVCDGGEIPSAATTVPPADALTADEIAQLTGPATEWLLAPSGATFDALAAAANALLETGRPVPGLPDGSRDANDVRGRIETLAEYPGEDYYVVTALQILQPFLPGLPAIVDGGSYTVGVDIEPGRYRTIGPVESCYWETLDDAGEINDNNFVNAAPQVIMTVRQSDFAVNSDGCAPWVRID